MEAIYKCCCVDGWTPQLLAWEVKKANKTAGKEIKKAIVQSGIFDRFTMFKDWHVVVYRWRFKGKLYAVVIHSAIEYFFEIE